MPDDASDEAGNLPAINDDNVSLSLFPHLSSLFRTLFLFEYVPLPCMTSSSRRIDESETHAFTPVRFFLSLPSPAARRKSATGDSTVSITYVEPDGKETTVEASLGEHLLDVAHANNIELEGTFVCVPVGAIGVKLRIHSATTTTLLCYDYDYPYVAVFLLVSWLTCDSLFILDDRCLWG